MLRRVLNRSLGAATRGVPQRSSLASVAVSAARRSAPAALAVRIGGSAARRYFSGDAKSGGDQTHEQRQKADENKSEQKQQKKGGAWAWYNEKLQTHPFLTKAITSGILFGAGDVLAQSLPPADATQLKAAFDGARTARAAAFGFLFLGPLSHIHYNFLEWLVVRRLAVSAAAMPFAKVFIEQFTYWTPSILSVYYVSIGLMEGKSADGIRSDISTKLWPAMKANWVLWPAAQLVNFKFVPLHLQLNFVLIVSLGWSCYLSRMSADAPKPNAPAAPATKKP